MRQKIGISTGCFLPWSAAGPLAVPFARIITKQIGRIDLWQALPFRGVTAKALAKANVPVKYREGAWNATTLLRHLRGLPGEAGSPTKWQDVIFFPAPEVCQRCFDEFALKTLGEAASLFADDRLIVSHTLPQFTGDWIVDFSRCGRTLIEVHPGLGLSAEELAEGAAAHRWNTWEDKPFVLDTRHLRRPANDSSPNPLGRWEEALEVLLSYTAAIHVQPLDSLELNMFIDNERTDLGSMLHQIRRSSFTGDFIIEVKPDLLGPKYFLNPRQMVRVLQLFRERIEEHAM